MSSRTTIKIPITWTSNKSQPILVADYRNIGLTVVGTGDITVLGTKEDVKTDVDFTVASTIDNSFASIVIADETLPNTYVNTLTVSGNTKLAEVNTNMLSWACIERSGGGVDAFITVSNNQ